LLYMFQPQIHTLVDGDKIYVAPQATSQPYTQQLEAVRTAYPNAEITQFRPNRAANRSSEVLLADAARTRSSGIRRSVHRACAWGARHRARHHRACH
jgi:uncharacterized iron-regulated membrane protein